MLDACVTFRDGIGVDDLTWLAELIAAVTTIVAAVWAMLRPSAPSCIAGMTSGTTGPAQPAGPGRSAVPGVMERLQSIDGELTRNGGNSLKNQVCRTPGNSTNSPQNADEHDDIKRQVQAVKQTKRNAGTTPDTKETKHEP